MKLSFKDNLEGRYCPKLFNFLEVSVDGTCWLCCPAWLPKRIGNILTDEFDNIWNGQAARQMRNQVFSGEWNYCNHSVCPQIVSGNLPRLSDIILDKTLSDNTLFGIQNKIETVVDLPTTITFSEDLSCNLRCPSCRVEKIMHKRDSVEYNKQKLINDKICNIFFSKPTDRTFEINVTGSGDPFASIIYREMLTELNGKDFPNLKVNLNTNGVMFTPKTWNNLHKIHNNLHNCRISIDAGTKETYETKTRLGGNWNVLMNNCKFLNEKAKEFKNFKIHFDFVVQQTNYKEMRQFIEMVLENFDESSSIHFSKIIDWNTWTNEEYNKNAVWKECHSEHAEFLKVLDDNIFDNEKVYLGNLRTYRHD